MTVKYPYTYWVTKAKGTGPQHCTSADRRDGWVRMWTRDGLDVEVTEYRVNSQGARPKKIKTWTEKAARR